MWTLGQHECGPWSFGVTYLKTEVEGSDAAITGFAGHLGEDEMMAIEAGVAYKVGPGITASASLLYVDWEEEADGFAGVINSNSDGVVGVVGLKFNF